MDCWWSLRYYCSVPSCIAQASGVCCTRASRCDGLLMAPPLLVCFVAKVLLCYNTELWLSIVLSIESQNLMWIVLANSSRIELWRLEITTQLHNAISQDSNVAIVTAVVICSKPSASPSQVSLSNFNGRTIIPAVFVWSAVICSSFVVKWAVLSAEFDSISICRAIIESLSGQQSSVPSISFVVKQVSSHLCRVCLHLNRLSVVKWAVLSCKFDSISRGRTIFEPLVWSAVICSKCISFLVKKVSRHLIEIPSFQPSLSLRLVSSHLFLFRCQVSSPRRQVWLHLNRQSHHPSHRCAAPLLFAVINFLILEVL